MCKSNLTGITFSVIRNKLLFHKDKNYVKKIQSILSFKLKGLNTINEVNYAKHCDSRAIL
jgi:hypothetical protein